MEIVGHVPCAPLDEEAAGDPRNKEDLELREEDKEEEEEEEEGKRVPLRVDLCGGDISRLNPDYVVAPAEEQRRAPAN